MAELLEERLRSHADAFNGLLDLIPAKMYFSQDTSDQWKKRKQTKEESQQAKRAKLDPDAPVTVKEVNDAKESKRLENVERQKVRQQKKAEKSTDVVNEEKMTEKKIEIAKTPEQIAEKRRKKRKEKKELEKEMKEEKKRRKELAKTKRQGGSNGVVDKALNASIPASSKTKKEKRIPKPRTTGEKPIITNTSITQIKKSNPATKEKPKDAAEDIKMEDNKSSDDEDDEEEEEAAQDLLITTNTLVTDITHGRNDPIAAPVSEPQEEGRKEEEDDDDDDNDSEDQDDIPIIPIELPDLTTAESSGSPVHFITSSHASTESAPTSTSSTSIKAVVSKDPIQQALLKERLAQRIEELRQKRKADSGSQPRNRSELMDQRRKREEARKERKKQMRIQAKVEEAKSTATSTTNTITNGKPSSAAAAPENNFAFGHIAFNDNSRLTASLDGLKATKKRKGATDAVGVMKQVEAKKARLANMTDEKREGILEKDRWDKALRLASGEKVRDDEGLLKKSVKRQEVQKRKSEKEWNERKAGVAKSKYMKQKKRDDNLQKRKDEKKMSKSGAKQTKKALSSKKKKSRAGFEGSSFGGGKKK